MTDLVSYISNTLESKGVKPPQFFLSCVGAERQHSWLPREIQGVQKSSSYESSEEHANRGGSGKVRAKARSP